MSRLARRLILTTAAAAALLAACGPAVGAVEGPRDECGLIEPTAVDIEYVLSFGSQTFAADDWIKRYTVEPYRVSLTRNNDTLGALAFFEYLIYNCGYGQADLDSYFNAANFDIVFSEYESYADAGFCEIENLALYEYDLVENGIRYAARYWVKQVSDTRVLVLMLVFPAAAPDALDQYSRAIFPGLTHCE
jgi:hypothetical protein